MENRGENQLPEAHSLPDGFVDSSMEALAPRTPVSEQEKSHSDRKEEGSELDHSNVSTNELSSDEFQTTMSRTEKTQKPRTFPVPLSETDNIDASVDSLDVANGSSVKQREGGISEPSSVNSVSEASTGEAASSEVKRQARGESSDAERCNYFIMYLNCNFAYIFVDKLHGIICGSFFYRFMLN